MSRNSLLAPSSPGRATRRDSLPELHTYVDTGCQHHFRCLTCPYSVCIVEHLNEARHEHAQKLHLFFQTLRDNGLTVAEVMARCGVSRRTVYRHSHASSR